MVLLNKPIRTGWLGAALAVILALSAAYFVDPEKLRVPLCPLHALTGLWCPTCGVTRAAHQLLHGHVAAALRFNPLLVVLLPVAAVGAWRGWLRRPAVGWMLLTVVVLFGIIRNVPVEPFTLLKP